MYWKKALYWNGLQNHLLFPYAEQLRAHQMKMNWAEGSFSDPITILNAYQVWKELCHSIIIISVEVAKPKLNFEMLIHCHPCCVCIFYMAGRVYFMPLNHR